MGLGDGLPRGPLSRADIFPSANTDSTESTDSFISQVSGECSPSPYSNPAQPPPLTDNDLPYGVEGMCVHPVRGSQN